MTGVVESLFLYESDTQCRFVLRAEAELNAALAAALFGGGDVWYPMQALLIAAADISKLLWGDFDLPEQAQQRAPLRRLLAVKPNSPLKGRTLRNHAEHIDTRILDVFGAPNAPTIFAGRNVGPYDSLGVRGVPRFFHYDPGKGLLVFGKEALSIPAVVGEVRRLAPMAHQEAQTIRS